MQMDTGFMAEVSITLSWHLEDAMKGRLQLVQHVNSLACTTYSLAVHTAYTYEVSNHAQPCKLHHVYSAQALQFDLCRRYSTSMYWVNFADHTILAALTAASTSAS